MTLLSHFCFYPAATRVVRPSLCLYSCAGEQETQAVLHIFRFAPERTASANDNVSVVGLHHRKAQSRPRFLVAVFCSGCQRGLVNSFESETKKKRKPQQEDKTSSNKLRCVSSGYSYVPQPVRGRARDPGRCTSPRFIPERTTPANDDACAVDVRHRNAQSMPRFLVAFFLLGLWPRNRIRK